MIRLTIAILIGALLGIGARWATSGSAEPPTPRASAPVVEESSETGRVPAESLSSFTPLPATDLVTLLATRPIPADFGRTDTVGVHDRAQNPIEGARVRYEPRGSRSSFRVTDSPLPAGVIELSRAHRIIHGGALEGRTGADGTCTFTGVLGGSVTVEVDGAFMSHGSGPWDHSFVALAAVPTRFAVLRTDGAPVPTCEITLEGSANLTEEFSTDPKTWSEGDDPWILPEGSYWLTAHADDWIVEEQLISIDREQVAPIEIILDRVTTMTVELFGDPTARVSTRYGVIAQAVPPGSAPDAARLLRHGDRFHVLNPTQGIGMMRAAWCRLDVQ